MIVVDLEKPFSDTMGVEVKAFDLRYPTWRDEKEISKKAKTVPQFEAVMQTLAEPVGSEAVMDLNLLNLISAWDVRKLEEAYAPFFAHPNTLDAETRAKFGLSAKS